MPPGSRKPHPLLPVRRALQRANWAVVIFLFGTLSLYFHLPGFGHLPDVAKLGIVAGLLVSNVFRLGYEAMMVRETQDLKTQDSRSKT